MIDLSLRDIPRLYAQDGKGGDAIVHVKLVSARLGWTWYILEYDPSENLAFALFEGFVSELGYVSIDELNELPWSSRPFEDEKFTPTRLGDLRNS